jgi:hypothetical protein
MRIPVLAALAVALPSVAHAQAWIKPGAETLILRVGAVAAQIETNARLDGTTSSGTRVDLESDAGLGTDKTTYLLGATWRFATNHRFDGLYNEVKRDATKTTERSFTIDDITYPAGTVLRVEQKTSIGYVGYRYSFLKNPDMEVAAGLGLYGGNFQFKFDANQPGLNVDESTTLPLPVLALSGDFYLTERATVTAAVRGLKVEIGDVDGSVFGATLAGEYWLTNNWGIGAALDYLEIEADVSKSDFRGNIEFKGTSGRLYLAARF